MRRRAGTPRGARRSSRPEHAGDLAIGVLRLRVLSLVVSLFALAECQSHFCDTTFEVQLERNESEAFSLDTTYQTPDFPFVQQELPGTRRLVVVVAGALVGRNMEVDQEDLPFTHDAIGVGDVRFAVTQ